MNRRLTCETNHNITKATVGTSLSVEDRAVPNITSTSHHKYYNKELDISLVERREI